MIVPFAALMMLELAAMPSDATVNAYEDLSFAETAASGKKQVYRYRLLKPQAIEPGKKYPLVLFLHGAGERGTDNKAQLAYLPEWLLTPENRKKYPCFVLAPQCPTESKWVEVAWGTTTSEPANEHEEQMQVVTGMLDDVMKSNPVDPRRVYLTGLSMGGYGSWDLAERLPKRFAAVVPVCGGGDERRADRLVDVPVWAWHGDADRAVPVERSRQMIEAIKKAGGQPKYTELKGVGHDSWNAAYNSPEGVLPWMFGQVKKIN